VEEDGSVKGTLLVDGVAVGIAGGGGGVDVCRTTPATGT